MTLHALDMKIDEDFTNIKERGAAARSSMIKIVEQRNDTLRQFHVIKTGEVLKAGKQYEVQLKYIGYLNNDLEGFYRSSYTDNNQTRCAKQHAQEKKKKQQL